MRPASTSVLIQQFLAVSQIEDPQIEQHAIEFAYEEMFVRIYQNPVHAGLVVDVHILFLDLSDSEVNHNRYIMLHQLNSLSRLTTGCVVLIDPKDMLTLSCVLEEGVITDGTALAEKVQVMIQQSHSLKNSWAGLENLYDHQRTNWNNEEEPSDPAEHRIPI